MLSYHSNNERGSVILSVATVTVATDQISSVANVKIVLLCSFVVVDGLVLSRRTLSMAPVG
jgi:hypothetical protein